MTTRIAFLVRSPQCFAILLCLICLLSPAVAQHGGGGGHSAGGHASGGRSSSRQSGGGHAGGHFGWLHFRSGRHSARHPGFEASSTSDTLRDPPAHLWNSSLARVPSTPRIPATLLWSPALFPRRPDGKVYFVSSRLRPHRGFFVNRLRRFPSSGCFFNGATQICFWEPLLPLLSCSGYFDPFYFGFGGDALDLGDDFNSQGSMPSEMSAVPPTANPSNDDLAEGNWAANPGATLDAATGVQTLSKGVFLLVLNNGTRRAVIDYWVADGYLEYISPDSTRSHIPLEALDLQNTVTENAPRGLPFVLRTESGQKR